MQRRQHEASTSAFSAVDSFTGNRVDVVVVSADAALLATLQEAAGPDHVLSHAPSADAAVELLVGGHCGILIADLQVVRNDAAALLERLQTQFPEVVLLATGRRDQEGAVAGLISKGSVYRFLHKPVSPARANLFLATATRRYHELSHTTSPALTSVRTLTQPANRLPLIGGAAAALLLAVGATIYLRLPGPPAVTTPPGGEVVDPQPALIVADVLATAQKAFAAGRLSAPPNDNALELYRAVVAVEVENAAAHAGVQEVIDALEVQVTQALQARNAPNAARALTVLQTAQPDHPQLAPLREQLLALSRSSRAEPVATPALAAQRTPVEVRQTPSTDLVRARLVAGDLLEPANDSALFHLRAARDTNEDESANRILATDLGSRLLARTRAAIAISDVEQARGTYGSAVALDSEFELALPELAEVAGELDDLTATLRAVDSRAVLDQLAPAIRLREGGQLIAPAGNNAFEALLAIAAQNPNAPEVRTEQQRLAFTLLDNARTAFVAQDLEQAELLITRAEELVPNMSNTRTLREQVVVAKEERAAASRVLQARELPRTREVPAAYPSDAQRRGTEGWVDVEFTIAADGTTEEFVVRDAQPVSVFDKAAVDALRKWRFEPIVRNGAPVAQRAVLRIRFTLN